MPYNPKVALFAQRFLLSRGLKSHTGVSSSSKTSKLPSSYTEWGPALFCLLSLPVRASSPEVEASSALASSFAPLLPIPAASTSTVSMVPQYFAMCSLEMARFIFLSFFLSSSSDLLVSGGGASARSLSLSRARAPWLSVPRCQSRGCAPLSCLDAMLVGLRPESARALCPETDVTETSESAPPSSRVCQKKRSSLASLSRKQRARVMRCSWPSNTAFSTPQEGLSFPFPRVSLSFRESAKRDLRAREKNRDGKSAHTPFATPLTPETRLTDVTREIYSGVYPNAAWASKQSRARSVFGGTKRRVDFAR